MTFRFPFQKILLAPGLVPGSCALRFGISRVAVFGLLLALSLLTSGTARAQSALDGFNPNANNSVFSIAVQADGKILVGGSFTNIGGQTRNSIARLNADGTVDTGFNPGADEAVSTLVVQPDGKILVGGSFTAIGGQARNSIARLNADGTVDTGFDPNAIGGGAFVLALQADGKILVGGGFTNIGGQTRNYIARLNSDGTLDTGFDPNADEGVYTLAVQTDGKILAGGNFLNIGGQARNRIARLNTNGTADTGFNPNADNAVQTLAVQADGKILVGGDFSSIGGQTRNRITRLNTDGMADAGFNPDANGTVFTLAIQADGKILVGGSFSNIGGPDLLRIARLNVDGTADPNFGPNPDSAVAALAVQADGKILVGGDFNSIGGQTRNYIARLHADGTVEVDADPNADNQIFALAVQADGKILVGGNFNNISGLARNRIARLNVDGTIDTDFNLNVDAEVLALAVQADGKILVGGNFNNIDGQPRSFLARLNEDGTLDTGFISNADNTVQSLAVQADGKILVGGNFNFIAGADTNRIVRLNEDGTRDTSFSSGADSDVHAIAIQTDGKIVIGGFFLNAGGQPRNHIARLNTDGSLDAGFDPNADENVDSLALQPDGKILAGGNFTNIGGQSRNHLARLNTDGTADAGFNPDVNSVVYALLVQADGKIVAGGSFASVGGQTRNGVARVNANGTVDTSFDPNADNVVFSLAMQSDGKIVIGGLFTNVGGQTRNRIARLTNTAALQTLSSNSTGTTITWSRSGTSPGIDRVTFEQSIDFGGSWTGLGDGSRVGTTANWQLTGLSLPTEQNLLLRARGYPLAGNFGGGDPSVYESLQLIYLAANTAPTFSTVATLTRQQASAATNSTIATVADAETAAGNLIVTTMTIPTGITVSNIVNTGGTITADVAASCSAATGSNTVVLQVSDGSATTTGNLTINVSANTLPTLTYNNVSVLIGDSTTINPATGPSDNGSVATIVLLSQGTYTGMISVNNATGVVSISNAAPVGTHTITIRATDNCGAVTDASFTLTVQACSYSISPTVQSFAAAGGNGTVAVTTGGVCTWSTVNNAPTWITITSSGSGTGNGTVTLTVSPNASTSPRSSTLIIAGQTFTVTQIASGTIVVGDFTGGIPPAWTVGDGGTPAVYNNTGTPLTWTTLNPCNRIIPPPFSGEFAIVDAACTIPGATLDEELRLPPFNATGLGSVFVEFYSQFLWDISAPNNKGDLDVSTDGGMTWINVLRLENASDGDPTPVLKSINITPYIAANPENVLVRLHYYGVSPPASLRAAQGKVSWAVDFGVYSYTFTPSSQSFPASGGSGSIAISTSVAIPSPQGEWTAMSNVPWITITSGASTRGNGTVTFTVDSNSGALRTGTITVSGRTFTVTQSCVPSPAGLIAWYSAEDNANDRQGNNNGTLQNSANFAAGFVGQAFNFDGVNDYVSTMLDTQPSALPNVTWEAWVYPTRINAATRQSIFSTDDGGFDRAVTIEADSANFGVFTGIGIWQPVAVTPNQWQHIAVVYTSSSIEFYKDGVKYTFGGAPTGQVTANRFHIGRNPSAAGEYYEGLVDEVGVYNRALTQPEIQTVVNANAAGRCGVCPTTTVGPENSTLSSGRVGQSYSQTFTASGGDTPYTFTLNTGSLPDGLAIAPDGVLSGTPSSSGNFEFTVRATDANGCSGVGTYSLVVLPMCGTIIISPPSLANGFAGTPYNQTFTATGGTGALTWGVSAGSLPPGLMLSSTGILSGTPTTTGSFSFTILATDANNCMGTASYMIVIGCSTISVAPPNTNTGTAGQSFSVAFTQTGGVGMTSFSTTSTLPTGLMLSTSGVLSGTPTQTGTFNITVKATDSNGCMGTSATYTLTINCQAIIIGPPSIASGNSGVPYNQQFTQSGGIGTVIFSTSSTLPTGITLSSGGLLSGTTNQTGSFPITVKVTDANGCTSTANYTLAIGCPTITLSSLPAGTASTAYNQTLTASPSGSYSFVVTAGSLPPGLSLASGGAITGTPTQAGTFNFTITATGVASCTGSRAYSLVINCPAITLSPASLPAAAINTAYSQTLSAAPLGTSYAFAVTSGVLPAGLALNSNGSFSGAPTQSGTFNFRITATGFGTCTGFRDYTLTIACPTITLDPTVLPNGTVGTAYNQTRAASPAGTYNYTVSSGALPGGLSLNVSTGAITGTPATAGTFNFTIRASAGACSGSRSYSITIGCPTITIAPASLPAGQAGVAYSQALTVTPSGTYTFSIISGSLPSGLTLNPSTGVIGGLPTVTGTYNFAVKAAASNGCDGTRTYTLVIACPTVVVNPTSLPNGTTGTAYSQTLSASPAGGNYTYAVTAGSLPAGLNLNSSTGVLSGTPTTNGTYNFSVTVTGFISCTSAPKSYSISIGGGGCPTITLPNIASSSTVGSPYNQSVAASPSGSYTYALSGTTPPGITLYSAAALLYGYPTTAGSYSFTITATDSNNCTASKNYIITIGAAFRAITNDFDGDGKSDLVVWRGKQGHWVIVGSSDGKQQIVQWGETFDPNNDVMACGDYDGDGKYDLAFYQRATGQWLIRSSKDGTALTEQWGIAGDVPVPGDYDGDGKADLAVWRESEGAWYIKRSSDVQTQTELFGASGLLFRDVPVPADYDGDGKTDIAIFRQGIRQGGHWYIKQSSDGVVIEKEWGLSRDVPVVADYDGDGKADIAVWRSLDNNWYILLSGRSSDGQTEAITWGTSSLGDVPAPGDYDGDGKMDIAVWRASEGTWYIRGSRDEIVMTKAYGQVGDTPVTGRR